MSKYYILTHNILYTILFTYTRNIFYFVSVKSFYELSKNMITLERQYNLKKLFKYYFGNKINKKGSRSYFFSENSLYCIV